MEKNNYISEEFIFNRLKELFSFPHSFNRDVIANIKPEDMSYIREIASGKFADIRRSVRMKTFTIISYVGSSEDCEILGQIISNLQEDSGLRAVAAVNLANFTSEIAEKELIKHLNVKDDLILSKIIKSLGMIGGPDAYQVLYNLEKDIKTNFVTKQLTFAKALIAYRHNLDVDSIPFIVVGEGPSAPPEDRQELRVKTVRARDTASALKSFEGNKYGIELVKSTGFKVTAGEAHWMLFLNKPVADEGIIKSINKRKWIMGLLARWLTETQTYSPQYVVLTKPIEGNEVQITVVRSDGEVFYAGKASVSRNILSFVISTIKRPGTIPFKVGGKFSLRGIELEIIVPISKRRGKRSPTTITLEDFQKKFPGK
jgi:hypothetical protein